MYYDENGDHHLVPESELPVILPLDLEDYKPTGKSPLEDHPSFPMYMPSEANSRERIYRQDNGRVRYMFAKESRFYPNQSFDTKKTKSVSVVIKHPSEDKILMIKHV